ncbi:uncharacterized protein KY384_007915 [Bacidia gigantensis]|uniref:uncharacterized protein n=1 Tax=Bacidia gigantensis TaxID=2732470 RepID=UPI001D043CD9|nr:uncharacterized protein KY384_007915 [Bacidia gigantensis]KAG8527761.1 hypothetical protein KY384_007915 [Bacidia gigantensis]
MSDVFSAQTRLAIAIDFGTANCSASWTYYRPESSACLLKDDFDIKGIHNVFFHGQTDRYMKTEFAWSQSLQKWILGNRIDSQIGKRNLREEDRITHVKLALDPCKHTEKIRNRIQDQVDALPAEAGIMSIDALVVKFLSLFYAEITTKLADHISLDKLQVETVIAIPAAWDLSLAHKMKMLAEKAGFRNVRPPVYEPDAAALYSRFDRSRLFDHAPASLADCEASFIIVDVGGGTAVGFWTQIYHTLAYIIECGNIYD